MSPLSLDAFRCAFPEFKADRYPDTAVKVRLSLAHKFFSPSVWKDAEIREHAMGLYCAHYLSAIGSAGTGGNGGASEKLGVVSSKAVDGVSVSFDTSTASETGAGFWNATAYGRELYQLMRIFGAGAVQL